MNLIAVRLNDNGKNTLGKLFIDGKFQCYTLEDTWRPQKIQHLTRVPAGTYDITLRTEGGFHQKYANHSNQNIRNHHEGMLWIRNVPGYEFILIHIGNYEINTSGCLLVGKDYAFGDKGRMITYSAVAYAEMYPKVADAINQGEKVTITILDADRE